ncbi:MAG: hypothetical protein RIR70_1469, partial [Pseudomonadota bacterium]
RSREQVASALGAHPTEVIFTSGGSEANNLFIKGAAACRRPGLIGVGATEHPCVMAPARSLRGAGWRLHEIAVDANGNVRADDYAALLEGRPAMISLMLANNETGVLHDIAPFATAAREAGAWFHSDAVQAFGKLAMDFRSQNAAGVNALTVSSHKIGGPQGAGALVIDKRLELAPLIAGGGQERGLRSGTENVAAIVGFGQAAALAAASLGERASHTARLQARLEAGLLALGLPIFGREVKRLGNTTYFAAPGIDGDPLVGRLDRAGFAVASGSACSSAKGAPSATLLAMGVSQDLARSAVRVSLAATNRDDEIDRFLSALERVINDLRGLCKAAN